MGTSHADKRGIMKEDVQKKIVKVEHDEAVKEMKIERIASPIVFKPVICADEVSLFILIDQSVINALKYCSKKEFKFTCATNSVPLKLPIKIIDYSDLIKMFHNYFWSIPDVADKIFAGTGIRGNNRMFKMIPRNHNWQNILTFDSPNMENTNDDVVFFKQIIK